MQGDWATAAAELIDSEFARQVGSRATEIAALIEAGADPT
jgi:hypothetical protein